MGREVREMGISAVARELDMSDQAVSMRVRAWEALE
jgi:DNA-binding transcriptional LysR family regulator